MEQLHKASALAPVLYDEMTDGTGTIRSHYEKIYQQFARMSEAELNRKQTAIIKRMMEEGITFTLYSESQNEPLERTIPFDPVPRVITRAEWEMLQKGLRQRIKALNLFLWDIYHDQLIVKEGIVPRRMIVGNRYFRPEMMRLDVPGGSYVTTAGIDIIRDEAGRFMVLEDNLRSPSGFSYLYKSRSIMAQLFPELYFSYSVEDVDQGLHQFRSVLKSLDPSGKKKPVIALLTPGSHNSAYYEHTFLAQQMGIELVEGRDLVCIDHNVYIRGMKQLRPVDVIYRRIDDDFLDPLAFRPDSLLGVPGLMNVYRAGNVAIANAPGTGVADDKAMYAYVPEMIRYYLGEEPMLASVPTYLLSRPEEREYALAHLDQLVVKETSLSGGYGMLIGPESTEAERHLFEEKICANPDNYIAQPTISLSTAPVLSGGRLASRHIDLRAFVLSGEDIHIIPGGLTRVAMKEGSLVVNSSQGGGCKDTWILRD
ncbi:circularly permuted type 2 ATP-grasp protein [Paenibacillus sp. y28]|uniref:circularly permuted type 2 ATP-grasp protein n=1 Tax=Paenibacillus sp. y28 TaxID=3129110 RepID=UPI003019BBDA